MNHIEKKSTISPEDRIHILAELGKCLEEGSAEIDALAQKAFIHNQWFTPENTGKALASLSSQFLKVSKLRDWIMGYEIDHNRPQVVGVITAGNIPLVGWHDLQCVFMAGHQAMIKCSAKDDVLLPGLIDILCTIDARCKRYFNVVDRLADFDAVIATGGDTAATHFHSYFGKYPHIIRKNRNSVALLLGQETEQQLSDLSNDILTYFGLGCRSVSKLYLPKGYHTDHIFKALYRHIDIEHHNKYKNNYDYSNAIYALGLIPFITNGFVIMREDKGLASRISCVHYEYYDNKTDVINELMTRRDDIQSISCIEDIEDLPTVSMGRCQSPALADYADGVDTMAFLLNL